MKPWQNLNGLSTVFYRSHSPYTRRTKPWQTWMASQSYFIILTVRTYDVQTHDRLEWLLNRISSFSQSIHTMYETMTDYHQCGACSGSPQIMSIKLHIAASIIAGLIEEHYTPVDPAACFRPSQAVSQCAQVVSSICSRPLSNEVASFGSSYPRNESSSTTPGDNIALCDPWEQEQLINCRSVLNLYNSLVDVARQMESHVVGCSVKRNMQSWGHRYTSSHMNRWIS